jgi:diguanylate cyclase (GGDEF)-like protein
MSSVRATEATSRRSERRLAPYRVPWKIRRAEEFRHVLDAFKKLTAVAQRLGERLTLDQLLRLVTDGAAELTGASRVSLRLLNPMRTKLLAACRAGEPLHRDPNVVFTVGEGLVGWVAQHHRALRTGDADHDPRFAPRPDMKEPMGSFLGVPLRAGPTCIGVLSAVHGAADYFTKAHERTLLLLAAVAAPHIEVARLSQVSAVDRLTRTVNRLGLDRFIAEDAAHEPPFCVAMVDVDHLALVNERFGMAIGDEVLLEVADRLSATIDETDVVVRYGGDEFLLVLAASDLERSARLAELAAKTVAKTALWTTAPSVTVTVSIGVAEQRAGENRDALIARAEEALSQAKKVGGGGVVRAT